jgi:hypothetical protein
MQEPVTCAGVAGVTAGLAWEGRLKGRVSSGNTQLALEDIHTASPSANP